VLFLRFFLQSPQYNTLAEPDENINNGKHHTLMKADEIALQIQHHVDSCVPEYLRKALAPELLDNRLRIQDMKFYQVGGTEYIVTGIGILVGALRCTVRLTTSCSHALLKLDYPDDGPRAQGRS
jgi:hypothetical protein